MSPADDDPLDAAFLAYLRQPVHDATDWGGARTELDQQLAKALKHGDAYDRNLAAAIQAIKGRVDQRRASVRAEN